MSDPFHSSRYCIDHADRRILELIRTSNAFIQTHPCKANVETDHKTSEQVLKIKLIKLMPIEIPGIVFDVLNNLRSALDHAGLATAKANGTKGRNAHFPFGKTRSEVLGRIKGNGRSRDIPADIFAIMVKAKPYRRGNRYLWALNDMCNANKHELIIPFAMGSPMVAFSFKGNSPRFSRRKKWDRLKNEREIARFDLGTKFRDHYSLATTIVFDKINVVEFKSVITVLERMLREVRKAFHSVEVEATKGGLFKRVRHYDKKVIPSKL